MLSMTVSLPTSRARNGSLTLAREDSEVLLIDVPVAGLASSVLAVQHGNPLRDPVLRYGHTPTGTFRFVGVYATGDGTRLPARYYGPHGIIALQAVSGQALLAEGAGRGILFIHGGPAGPNNSLRSTVGALRVANADMLALRSLIGSGADLSCLCFTDDETPSPSVYDDAACRLIDNIDQNLLMPAPTVSAIAPTVVSRRNVIRRASAAFIIPIAFVAAAPEVAFAQSY